MSKERNYNIDLAKTLAMVLVVMQHAWSMLDLDSPELGLVCSAYRSITTVGVPLFVFLSGALLLPRKIGSLKDFYKKRLVRLLVPFVLLGAIAYLLSLLSGAYTWWDGTWQTAIVQFVPKLLENNINIFHWYVHMLLILYILTPLLQRFVQSISTREYEFILLCWGILMVIQQYYPDMYVMNYLSPPLIKYIGVFLAGNYITQYRVGNRNYLYIGIVSAVAIYVLNVLTDCAIYLGVPLMAIALGMICMNLPNDKLRSLRSLPLLVNTSRYSYTIYLLHVILIRLIYNLSASYYPTNIIPYCPILITIVVMSLFYIGCRLYDKTKWLPNFIIGIG